MVVLAEFELKMIGSEIPALTGLTGLILTQW
jgi:hypothetical protein